MPINYNQNISTNINLTSVFYSNRNFSFLILLSSITTILRSSIQVKFFNILITTIGSLNNNVFIKTFITFNSFISNSKIYFFLYNLSINLNSSILRLSTFNLLLTTNISTLIPGKILNNFGKIIFSNFSLVTNILVIKNFFKTIDIQISNISTTVKNFNRNILQNTNLNLNSNSQRISNYYRIVIVSQLIRIENLLSGKTLFSTINLLLSIINNQYFKKSFDRYLNNEVIFNSMLNYTKQIYRSSNTVLLNNIYLLKYIYFSKQISVFTDISSSSNVTSFKIILKYINTISSFSNIKNTSQSINGLIQANIYLNYIQYLGRILLSYLSPSSLTLKFTQKIYYFNNFLIINSNNQVSYLEFILNRGKYINSFLSTNISSKIEKYLFKSIYIFIIPELFLTYSKNIAYSLYSKIEIYLNIYQNSFRNRIINLFIKPDILLTKNYFEFISNKLNTITMIMNDRLNNLVINSQISFINYLNYVTATSKNILVSTYLSFNAKLIKNIRFNIFTYLPFTINNYFQNSLNKEIFNNLNLTSISQRSGIVKYIQIFKLLSLNIFSYRTKSFKTNININKNISSVSTKQPFKVLNTETSLFSNIKKKFSLRQISSSFSININLFNIKFFRRTIRIRLRITNLLSRNYLPIPARRAGRIIIRFLSKF